MKFRDGDAEQPRSDQLLVERVEVQENVREVRIRAEGLASLASCASRATGGRA